MKRSGKPYQECDGCGIIMSGCGNLCGRCAKSYKGESSIRLRKVHTTPRNENLFEQVASRKPLTFVEVTQTPEYEDVSKRLLRFKSRGIADFHDMSYDMQKELERQGFVVRSVVLDKEPRIVVLWPTKNK